MWETEGKKQVCYRRMQRHKFFIYYTVNGKINTLRKGQLVYTNLHINNSASQ